MLACKYLLVNETISKNTTLLFYLIKCCLRLEKAGFIFVLFDLIIIHEEFHSLAALFIQIYILLLLYNSNCGNIYYMTYKENNYGNFQISTSGSING